MRRRRLILILTPVQLRMLAASPSDSSQDLYVSTMVDVPQARVRELREQYLQRVGGFHVWRG